MSPMEIRFSARELWVKCMQCYHADPKDEGILPDGNYVFRWKIKPGAILMADELTEALNQHQYTVHGSNVDKS